MGVASCRSIYILSDVVFNRASVSFRFSFRDLIPISGRACSGFPARPGPAPGARPWCPTSPPCVPPPSLYLIFFSRTTTSLSLSSTSFALGVILWMVAADRRIPRWAPLSSLLPPFLPPLAPPGRRRRPCAWSPRGPFAPPTRPRALPAQLARRGPNLAPGTRSPVPTRVALARATFKF
jgi:hypothetical protein